MDDVTHHVGRVAVGLKALSTCVAAYWKIDAKCALVWVDGRCVNVLYTMFKRADSTTYTVCPVLKLIGKLLQLAWHCVGECCTTL